jgi:GNAT superfamily N-acetyltransferase
MSLKRRKKPMRGPNDAQLSIRRAKIDEAALLTNLALRAKIHWGYSAEFMAAARAGMIVTVTQLATQHAFVAEKEGSVLGFYKLRGAASETAELTDLFVEPRVIGHGVGRMLWKHAVETARSLGYSEMTWESDPHAEGFYLHMGAQRVGEVASGVKPGRFLPKMSYNLRKDEESQEK